MEKYVTFKNASKSWNINAVFESIRQKTDQDKLALWRPMKLWANQSTGFPWLHR